MSTIRPRAWMLFVLLAIVALVAACGGSDEEKQGATAATTAAADTSGGATSAAADTANAAPPEGAVALGAAGTDGKGAAAVPADALAFVSVNIDRESDGWKKFIEVSSRFPGFAKVAADFQKEISTPSGDGTDFAKDIEPWLGGEVAVGVIGIDISDPQSPKAQVVGYVESKDDAAAAAAIAKGGDAKPAADYQGYKVFDGTSEGDSQEMWAGVGDGALLIATSEADLHTGIDTRAGDQAASLAGSADFGATLGKLPQNNMAVVYVNGAKAADLLKVALAAAQAQTANDGGVAGSAAAGLAASQAQLQKAVDQLASLKGIGMSFGAEDAGYRLRTVVTGDPAYIGQMGGVYSPKLLERVPADAYAFVSFRDLGKNLQPQIEALLAQQPSAKDQLEQAEAMLGLSLNDDVFPMLMNEHALFVGPGLPVGVGLLLTPTDQEGAAKVMRQLVALGTQAQPGTVASDITGGQQVTIQGLPVVWRQVDGVLAISNVASAGDKPSQNLSQSPSYQAALAAAGTPAEVSQLAFVDVQKAIAAGQALSGGYSAEAMANLAPLTSIVAWSESADDTATADLFVGVGG